MSNLVAFDTSVIVGLLDLQDIWHGRTLELLAALDRAGHSEVIFDCVLAEAISTLARRFHEKRQASAFPQVIEQIHALFPDTRITWLYPSLPSLFQQVTALVSETGGELNFNDALIALACRERSIPMLASFDSDFDRIAWLRRVTKPNDL